MVVGDRGGPALRRGRFAHSARFARLIAPAPRGPTASAPPSARVARVHPLDELRTIRRAIDRARGACEARGSMVPPMPEPQDYLSASPGDRRDALQRGVEARSERILIVEDDADIARFVQVNLVNNGPFADVVIAGDPMEALERVEHEHFDLIITGVVMPKMTGYDLVRRLRERPDTADTPIMFLTARVARGRRRPRLRGRRRRLHDEAVRSGGSPRPRPSPPASTQRLTDAVGECGAGAMRRAQRAE